MSEQFLNVYTGDANGNETSLVSVPELNIVPTLSKHYIISYVIPGIVFAILGVRWCISCILDAVNALVVKGNKGQNGPNCCHVACSWNRPSWRCSLLLQSTASSAPCLISKPASRCSCNTQPEPRVATGLSGGHCGAARFSAAARPGRESGDRQITGALQWLS